MFEFGAFFQFGALDNLVLAACLYGGIEIESWLPIPRRYRSKVAGAAIGALVGNAISDGIAAIPQGIGPVVQVTSGCLVALVVLPLLLRRFAVAA